MSGHNKKHYYNPLGAQHPQQKTHKKTDWVSRINTAILWSFCAIFFLVPIVMYPTTYELFEFNKMWITFGFGLTILFLWASKILIQGKITIRRTPLDIPLLLFLLSQFISTIFSMDPHVSWWGYYSRWNGGFLSSITYVFLYYAFTSNVLDPVQAENASVKQEKSINARILLYLSGVAAFFLGAWISAAFTDTGGKMFFLALTTLGSFILFMAAAPKNPLQKFFSLIIASGLLVALWGFPSHFGYDPTCLVFRGTLDVSCWTDAFQPKIRIFSTLGQPNWMAAFMAILIPITIAYAIKNFKSQDPNSDKTSNSKFQFSKNSLFGICYLVLGTLFYIDLLWTRSQSGIGGFWIGEALFALVCFFLLVREKFNVLKVIKNKAVLALVGINFIILILTFFIPTGIAQVDKYNFYSLQTKLATHQASRTQQTQTTLPSPSQTPTPSQTAQTPTTQPANTSSGLEVLGGTDSGTIRKIVWKGALDIFKQHPLFGTGVETYAFAYYQVRPAEHNMTSEWDYLYNKAHNEYLNYLATTGIFGLGTYLLFIVLFFVTAFVAIKHSKLKTKPVEADEEDTKHSAKNILLGVALVGSLISILISNFFGFSVVIVNLFLFMIPIFFYEFLNPSLLKPIVYRFSKPAETQETSQISSAKTITIFVFGIIILYLQFLLFWFWLADQSYSLGYNYDKAGRYDLATAPLQDAVQKRPGEDLFKDELSLNLATMALALAQQNQATQAASLFPQIKQLSDQVTTDHPNNVVYFKTRTRVLYSMAQLDKQYFPEAMAAIEHAHELAPTDAKILYNLALLTNEAGDREKAIEMLKQTVQMKANYRDAFYALALYLSQDAQETKDKNIAQQDRDQAKQYLEYTLTHNIADDKEARDLLKSLQ